MNKIDLIIKDVDASTAQKILALLNKDESVTVEKEVKSAPVADKDNLTWMKRREAEAPKEKKKYTCDRCGKVYTYANSYNSHRAHCKAPETKKPVSEEPKPPVKAKPKFKRNIKVPKKPAKKAQPKYKGISDDALTDMVVAVLTGNLNAIVTSAQISGNYITSQKKKFGASPEVIKMSETLETRVVKLLTKAAKALGPSQCMSMPISPNGLQVALFAKSISAKDLKKKLN